MKSPSCFRVCNRVRNRAGLPQAGIRSLPFAAQARRLSSDRRGSALVEFALVSSVLVVLSLAALDLAALMFDYHRAGEATRRAARTAAIEAPIVDLSALVNPAALTCRGGAGGPSCSGAAIVSAGSFDLILADARAILPTLAPENLEIEYRDSGLGTPDSPAGILPLVTVRLSDARRTLSLLDSFVGLPAALRLPEFASSYVGNGK